MKESRPFSWNRSHKNALVGAFTQELGRVPYKQPPGPSSGSCILATRMRPPHPLSCPINKYMKTFFFFLNYASSEWKQCQRGVSPGSEKMSMDKERAIVHLFFCSLKVKCEQAGSKVPAPPKSLRHTGPCLCALWQALLGMPPHWRIWEKNLVGKRGNKEVTGKPEPVGSNEFLNK